MLLRKKATAYKPIYRFWRNSAKLVCPNYLYINNNLNKFPMRRIFYLINCLLLTNLLFVNEGFMQTSLNDSCTAAPTILAIGDAVFADSITAETTNAVNPVNGTADSPDVWYSFVGTGGLVDIEVISEFDAQMAVYDDCAAAELEFRDDPEFMEAFCAEAGVTYYIQVQAYNVGVVGNFTLTVNTSTVDATYCSNPAALNFNSDPSSCLAEDNTICLLNNTCSGAIAVSCGEVINGTNVGATEEEGMITPACGPAIEGPGAWYVIQGDGSEMTASTCGSTYDSRMHVFSGSCGSFVCEGGNEDFDCNGDGTTFDDNFVSQATWISSAGTDYYIYISGFGGGVGDFQLSITCDVPSCTPPLNDKCVDASSLTDAIPLIGTNVCAQTNDLQPGCDPFGVINGVWYEWNSGVNNAATVTFDVAAAPAVIAAVNLSIAVYSGSCGVPTEIFCGGFGLPVDQNLTDLDLNTDYLILVWTTTDANEGEFDLTITGGTSGCTLEGSCNYAPAATIDDGFCDPSCLGCIDEDAINFSAIAATDDGSCILVGCDPASADNVAPNVTPVAFGFCYEEDDVTVYTFAADTPGEGVAIIINSGTVENNADEFEVYDGAGNTAAQINTALYGNAGDLTGFAFAATGDTISIAVISDVSISCASGDETSFDISVYCGSAVVYGCTNPNASNYDAANTIDDGSCNLEYCDDPASCNYIDPTENGGDGTGVITTGCCFENCTTISMTDGFGDGGTIVTLFDDASNVIATLIADAVTNELSDICMPNGCASLVISTDFAPGEVGIIITTQDGVIYEAAVGSLTGDDTVLVDFGNTGDCCFPGCSDPVALNYNPYETCDCIDIPGGSDASCCIYERVNNECDGAIALTVGTTENWSTITEFVSQSASTNSGNNCGTNDSADGWYSYTPACDVEATFTSTAFFLSGNTTELAVWEGDCASLSNVACVTSDVFANAEVTLTLAAGVTYYIQVSSTGGNDQGTLDIIEELSGPCEGCISSDACNYNSSATLDDGSCIFISDFCGDPADEIPSIVNSNCICTETRHGDYNYDFAITVTDLTPFLSEMGTVSDGYLIGDFSGDYAVTVLDLTDFLGSFGSVVTE